jgi:hypothetical protein
MTITPAGAVPSATQPAASSRGQTRTGSGFAVPNSADQVGAGLSAQPGHAPAVASAGAMLALQEQAGQSVGRSAEVADREARRHGRDMLEALAALQRALLDEVDPALSLVRLAALAETQAPADDPALASIVSAIRLRARLELLRRTRDAGEAAQSPGPESAIRP